MGKRKRGSEASGATASHFIFYVRGFILLGEYQIYKLPLFLKPSTDSSPVFSLKRCTNLTKAPPEFSLSRPRRIGCSFLGRFNRHSQLRKAQTRLRRFLNRPMPKPYIEFQCTGFGAGVLPEETAIAALGSKIYFMGGYVWTSGDRWESRRGMLLPTHVHIIDTASPGPPVIVKTSSELNSGKRSPVAWTVGGKIYVMPKTFVAREPPGDFECLDPASGSWKVLPSPPFVNDISKFTIPANSYLKPDPLLHINNSTVLGSSLIIIVTHAGDIYGFDTAHPDKGWSSVTVLCGSSEMCVPEKLNFLPFDGQTSVPVSDDLVLSHWGVDSFPPPNLRCVTHFSPHTRMRSLQPYIGPGLAEKMFLKTRCGIIRDDTYACRVAEVESDSSTTTLSLHVKRVELPIRWEELVGEGPCGQWMDVTRIGDGLVLISKGGGDEDCDPHCSFNVVRIEKVDSGSDEQLVLTNLSSVLLTPFGVWPNHLCSFLMKDTTFTTGF